MLPVFESCMVFAEALPMFELNVKTLLKIVPETVRPVRVPTLVMFACAFPVTAPDVATKFTQDTPDPVPVAARTCPETPETPEIERFERLTKYEEFMYGTTRVFKLKFIAVEFAEKLETKRLEVFVVIELMVFANTFVV